MATGATELIDHTTADAFIPELWSMKAIVAREQELVLAPLSDRQYQAEMKYGDTLHVVGISNLSVQVKSTSANAATLYETITESLTDITVTVWEYNAIALESATRRQANRDLLATYAPKQGYALAQAVDDGIATLAAAVSGQTVGALLTPITYDNVLRARQYIDDANAPTEGRQMVIPPAQEAEFLKLDQYINRDYDALHGQPGSGTAADRAYIGDWLNIPVYKTTNSDGSNAAGHSSILFQKEAFALVVQMNPTSHQMWDMDYFADKTSIEQLRGNATMRADHACRMQGL